MRRVIQVALWVALALAAHSSRALEPGWYAVNAKQLNVRLAPAPDAQVVIRLERGAKVRVFQVAGQWARVSDYYDGKRHGLSGMVARWVAARFLGDSNATTPARSKPQPRPTPAAKTNDTGLLAAVVAKSEDFATHRTLFVSTAQRLIDSGTCTLADFRSSGGWTRDVAVEPPTYFTFCAPGGKRKSVFLDPLTGTVFH